MREVFLQNLPTGGLNRGNRINWNESIEEFVDFQYDDVKGKVKIINYDQKEQMLYIKYENKEPFKISTGNFKKCKLGKLLGKRTDEFKIEIGTHYKDNKRDITIIDMKRKGNFKYYKYKCNKCGFDCGEHYKNGELKKELWTLESGLIQGNGCACCCPAPKVVVPHINSIVANEETHWMVNFFKGGYEEAKKYTPQSGQKIKPICPDCGNIKYKEISIASICNNKSIGCLICGDGFSFGHKYIFNLLTQINVKFQDNKTYEWCKFKKYKCEKETTGEYDFVIEDMKLIIEIDGEWHRKDNTMSGQTKEESKYIDDMKDKLAKQHEYKVVRIIDENSIKGNILDSELINIFDLSNVNWLKCEEFALKNRCKEVCELKRNEPNMTTTEIEKIMKLSKSTVINYLKRGTVLGWCNYDSKEEWIKNSRKNGKMNSKQVEVLKDNILLGIFESTHELARQSKTVLGFDVLQATISSICRGKRKCYEGFIFKYV